MKIITYNMLHNKRSKRNWASILDKFDPDIVLAQESLAPDAYRQPLLDEDNWQEQAAWSTVNDACGSAVYLKSEVPTKLAMPDFDGWVVGVQAADVSWTPRHDIPLQVFSIHAPTGQGECATVVNSILDMIAKQRNGCDVVILDEASIVNSPMLPYIRTLVGMIDGVWLSQVEVVAWLLEVQRQRSIVYRSRRDYVLSFLHEHPP